MLDQLLRGRPFGRASGRKGSKTSISVADGTSRYIGRVDFVDTRGIVNFVPTRIKPPLDPEAFSGFFECGYAGCLLVSSVCGIPCRPSSTASLPYPLCHLFRQHVQLSMCKSSTPILVITGMGVLLITLSPNELMLFTT